MNIKIVITGTDRQLQRLKNLKQGLTSFQPAMKTIGDTIIDYTVGEVFASQGGVLGATWPKLQVATQLRKNKIYPGRPPLVFSGDMIQNFKSTASDNGVYVTNAMDYFKYHQSSEARKGNLPRRQMLGVNDTITAKVRAILLADIQTKIRNV